ncbi:hypothetical protein [Sulfitobacter geojensis]|uniref:hypothetical protein n=1 Tax=Sulfitobacter geojensis TaxID=1342299 RepID=UPI0036DDE531
MRPDFIFFSEDETGAVQANIIDPHEQFLADYAESREVHFGRIEASGKVGDAFRVLDLLDVNVRDAIRLGPSAKTLFEGPKAQPYPKHRN